MRKLKLLFVACALIGGGSFVHAQTDVTNLLVNPSFEYSADGVAYSGTTELTNGTDGAIYGWTGATISNNNKNIQITNSAPNTAFGTTSASDGSMFYFIRQGWENKTSSIGQDVILPVGRYFLTVDYKEAEAHDNNTFLDSKVGITIKKGNDALSTFSIGGSVNAPGASYFTDINWKTIGTWFDLSEESSVNIGLTFTLNGSSKRADLCLDNVKLYKWDLDDQTNYDNASKTNPMDVTAKFVTNPYFNSNTDGWTSTTGYQNNARATNQAGAFSGGFYENWNSSAKTSGKMYQSLSGLPDGIYSFTAAAFVNSENANVSLYAGSQKTAVTNTTPSFYSVQTTVVGGSLEIGLELGDGNAANWIGIDNVKLEYLGFDVDAAIAAAKEQATAAESHLNDKAYTGYITALQNAINAINALDGNTATKTSVQTAIGNLNNALDNVSTSVADYSSLNTNITYAKAYSVVNNANVSAYSDAISAAEAVYNDASVESTAATILSLQNYKAQDYTFITSTYTETATLGSWTEDFAEDLSGEGYMADGAKYWNEWGTSTRTGKQKLTLPAGDYAISCIGRGNTGTSGYLYYKIGDADAITTNFLMKGNRGRGVETSGAANFADDGTYNCNGEGFGWEYRFLTFTLTEETSVEIGVSATFASNWVSIYAPVLLTTEASAKNVRLAEIAAALATVPTGNMNATVKSALDSKKAVAEAASTSNTKDELVTILNELNDAISAANASIAEYTKISDYLSTTSTNVAGDYSAITAAITAGSYENSVDGMAAVKARRNTIATTGMTAGKDLTALIDNNSFETGNTNFWTVTASSDTGARNGDNYKMSNQDGEYVFNTWWQGTPLTQNIGTLPAGAYQLKGVVASDGGTVYITMNDSHEAFVETVEATSVGIEFAYTFTLDAEQEVTIGLVGGADGTKGAHKDYSANGYWFYKADNFRLSYLGTTAPENTIDGTYYLATGGNMINRGGDSGTEGVMATEGIPVVISTDKAGISTLKMKDTDKYLFYSTSEVYTDGTIDPAKTHHKPYWKVTAVNGGYTILNTQSGLYLNTTTATRNEEEITVVTCSAEAAVWTFSDALLPAARIELANAIAAAPATPTANVGNGVFQIPTAEVTKLTNAIAAAQAVYDNANATLAEVQTAKATLETALEDVDLETLNAPADGQLFNVILTYNGWTYDKKAMTYIAGGRTDAGLYNIQYKEAANQNLAQAFTFTKVSGNNYKMSQIDADGVARYISTGVPYNGNTSQIRTVTNADDALIVTVIPTATEGVWNLKNVAANNYIGSQDAGVYTVNSHIDFNIVETQKPSITINTTAAGYGTTILPFAVASLPDGVKAYTCAAFEGNQLTLVEATALDANKPYILEGAWNETLTGDAQGTALSYTEGLLTGVYTATPAPVGSYVMQKNNDKVGFYKVAEGEGKQPTVGANRIYVTATAASARAFILGGGETTAISAIEALASGEATIYNTNGVQQPRLQKGMNIIKMNDGSIRKIMVK